MAKSKETPADAVAAVQGPTVESMISEFVDHEDAQAVSIDNDKKVVVINVIRVSAAHIIQLEANLATIGYSVQVVNSHASAPPQEA